MYDECGKLDPPYFKLIKPPSTTYLDRVKALREEMIRMDNQ
jgi:hypothetical protein